MLFLISFSFLIFTSVSSLEYDHELKECFNFTTNDVPQRNVCQRETDQFRPILIDQRRKVQTMACVIDDLSLINMDTPCSSKLYYARLVFANNTLFEFFFKQFHTKIPRLFGQLNNGSNDFFLTAIIRNYNITEITDEYLVWIKSIKIPKLIVQLTFVNHLSNSPLHIVRVSPLNMTINGILIQIRCKNKVDSAFYVIKKAKVKDPALITLEQCKNDLSTPKVIS